MIRRSPLFRTAAAGAAPPYRSHVPHLAALLTIPLLNIAYPLLNRPHINTRSLMTPVDAAIPFVPIFAVPYMLWYVFVFCALIGLCLRDRPGFYRTLLAIDLGLIACYCIFLLFQTTVPRPDVVGVDWVSALTRFVYATDKPFNCFPSIHVLTSWLVARALWRSPAFKPAVKYGAALFSLSIIVSTLFLKQHVLFDAAGAILLAEIGLSVAGRLMTLHEAGALPWPRKRSSSSTTKKTFLNS